MEYAPIVVFAFNRLEVLKACIDSLLSNSEVSESDLIVFVDGAREGRGGEKKKVEDVREFVKNITGFKSLTYQFSDKNQGLANSIIDGISRVMMKYDRAIVIEDDLIVSKNFLSFMNQGLEYYEKNKKVWSVCGFSVRVKTPVDYVDNAYFCPRSSSWGWATWADRWNSCDWTLNDWDTIKKNASAFNQWGGSDCFGMLKAWKEGRNQSWAIRFCYNQFVNDALSLFPMISKIANEGFDGNGTNCKQYNRYKFEFDTSKDKTFKMPEQVSVNKSLRRQFMWYYSIPLRAYSRLRYVIDAFKNRKSHA